jgi:hypothetical protein
MRKGVLLLSAWMWVACDGGKGGEADDTDRSWVDDTDPPAGDTDGPVDTDLPADDTDGPVDTDPPADDTDPVDTDPPADDTDPVDTDLPADDTDPVVDTDLPADDTDVLVDTDPPPPLDTGTVLAHGCAPGRIDFGFGCMRVGPQGCRPEYIDAEGLCRPTMAHCPDGQFPDLDDGCVTAGIRDCDPVFLQDGWCRPTADVCGPGELPVPQEGCVSVDGPGCGAAPWGNIAPTPGTLWVDPAAAPGGDGSQATPFTRLADALAVAPAGGRVALAEGRYTDPVVAADSLEIVGRCASRVVLSGISATPDGDSIVVHNGPGTLTLRDLQLTGAGHGLSAYGGEVVMERVLVHRTTARGLMATGVSSVLLDHVYVRSTQAQPNLDLGTGMRMQGGGTLTVRHSAFVDNIGISLAIYDPDTTLVMDDSLIEGTRPALDDNWGGYGIYTVQGGDLVLTDSAIKGGNTAGLYMLDDDSQLDFDHSHCEGVDLAGVGLTIGVCLHLQADVQGAPTALVHDSTLIDFQTVGVGLFGVGAHADVDRTYFHGILNTQQLGFPTFSYGYNGVNAQDGSSAVVRDSMFDDIVLAALATDMFGQIDAERIVSRSGAIAAIRGTINLTDAYIDSPRTVGLYAALDQHNLCANCVATLNASQVIVSDAVVWPYANQVNGTFVRNVGDGVLSDRGVIHLDRALVEGAGRVGMLFEGGQATVDDALIRENRYGVVLQSGGNPALGPRVVVRDSTQSDLVQNGNMSLP